MPESKTQKPTSDEYAVMRDSGVLLRLAGGLGALVSAIVVVSNGIAWIGAMMQGRLEAADPFAAVIMGHSMRLVIFLLAYAAGTALPAWAKTLKAAGSQMRDK